MQPSQTRTTPHGAHARTASGAPSGRTRRGAEPGRSEREATRRAAELAACEAGVPAELPGGFELARLSKNRRSGDILYVYRREGGGTFCANQKGVQTRLATLLAEPLPEAPPVLSLAPAPAPALAPALEAVAVVVAPSPAPPVPQASEGDLRGETPTCAAIAFSGEVWEVATPRAWWIERYGQTALLLGAVLAGAVIVIRVAIALGA